MQQIPERRSVLEEIVIVNQIQNQEKNKKRTKPKNRSEVEKFWNFINKQDDDTAELILYGDISSYSWYKDDITPTVFNEELQEIGDVSEIIVRINSGGGDVFAALAIYTRLKDHKATIHVKIDGWCASAATLIAMAGDVIEIPSVGILTIHDPLVGLYGYYNETNLQELQKELIAVKQSIVNCYMTKTSKSEDEIKSLMTEEKWYIGQEAVDAGFCTAILWEEDVETEVEDSERIVVNNIVMDISGYHTIPKGLIKNSLNHGKKNEGGNENMTVEEFKAKYPTVAEAFKNEILAQNGAGTDVAAVQKAIAEERERIKAIDECTLEGFEDLAEEAKYTNPISAEEFAMSILKKQKGQGQEFLNNREEDVRNSGANEVGASSNRGREPEAVKDVKDEYSNIIDELYPKKN